MTEDPSRYFAANRALWDRRARYHVESDFYDVAEWKRGAESLNWIELDLLGDVAGKELLHLQCHFGQDTLSLARRGARVTGVDFSREAIAIGRAMASELGLGAEFVEANVYDLEKPESPLSGRTFDLVFASYGVVGWLPDLASWGRIVAAALKPGGRFVFVEFHPVVWMFDDSIEELRHSYFRREVIETETDGSYAATDAPIRSKEYGWNHSLAEVVTALLAAGLSIERFDEYDDSPYSCFPGMFEREPGRFRFTRFDGILPLVYSLVAVRREQG